MTGTRAWMRANLTTQGYCLSDADRRELALGLRYIWNHAARQLVGAPALPPNPTRRRHAFKVATVWLLTVGALLAVGATTTALVLGGLLVAACTTVTATNLCLPSEALAWWERRASATPPMIGKEAA